MRTLLGRVCSKRVLSGHLRATSRNSWNTVCEEPVKLPSSRRVTSRLSRKTQRSVANRVDGVRRASLAPLRAAIASASKTSALGPSGVTWRLRRRPY
jgi:hypothetical protein